MFRPACCLMGLLLIVLPSPSTAGGAHRVAPFSMDGQVSDLQVQEGLISFRFTGTISGENAESDGRSFQLSLSVRQLPIKVKRAVAYRGSSSMGAELGEDPVAARECFRKPSVRVTIPLPVLVFNQTMPETLEGDMAQFYGCLGAQ